VKLATILLALCTFCCAQQSPAEVPVENEPHHHLVFENEYVRVFKVEVPPHQQTLVHRHKRDYVVVTIGDATVTNAVVGKEPKRWNFKDGDVTFLEASGEKSFAHKAVNEGEGIFLNFTIELKKRMTPPPCTKACGVTFQHQPCAYAPLTTSTGCSGAAEQAAVLVDGKDFRVARWVIAGSMHHLEGLGGLVIPLSDCEIKIAQNGEPYKTASWRSGKQVWVESPFPASTSAEGCAFVELKFREVSYRN
jgi:quercetin dioxygenase-like cupin family protein